MPETEATHTPTAKREEQKKERLAELKAKRNEKQERVEAAINNPRSKILSATSEQLGASHEGVENFASVVETGTLGKTPNFIPEKDEDNESSFGSDDDEDEDEEDEYDEEQKQEQLAAIEAQINQQKKDDLRNEQVLNSIMAMTQLSDESIKQYLRSRSDQEIKKLESDLGKLPSASDITEKNSQEHRKKLSEIATQAHSKKISFESLATSVQEVSGLHNLLIPLINTALTAVKQEKKDKIYAAAEEKQKAAAKNVEAKAGPKAQGTESTTKEEKKENFFVSTFGGFFKRNEKAPEISTPSPSTVLTSNSTNKTLGSSATADTSKLPNGTSKMVKVTAPQKLTPLNPIPEVNEQKEKTENKTESKIETPSQVSTNENDKREEPLQKTEKEPQLNNPATVIATPNMAMASSPRGLKVEVKEKEDDEELTLKSLENSDDDQKIKAQITEMPRIRVKAKIMTPITTTSTVNPNNTEVTHIEGGELNFNKQEDDEQEGLSYEGLAKRFAALKGEQNTPSNALLGADPTGKKNQSTVVDPFAIEKKFFENLTAAQQNELLALEEKLTTRLENQSLLQEQKKLAQMREFLKLPLTTEGPEKTEKTEKTEKQIFKWIEKGFNVLGAKSPQSISAEATQSQLLDYALVFKTIASGWLDAAKINATLMDTKKFKTPAKKLKKKEQKDEDKVVVGPVQTTSPTTTAESNTTNTTNTAAVPNALNPSKPVTSNKMQTQGGVQTNQQKKTEVSQSPTNDWGERFTALSARLGANALSGVGGSTPGVIGSPPAPARGTPTPTSAAGAGSSLSPGAGGGTVLSSNAPRHLSFTGVGSAHKPKPQKPQASTAASLKTFDDPAWAEVVRKFTASVKTAGYGEPTQTAPAKKKAGIKDSYTFEKLPEKPEKVEGAEKKPSAPTTAETKPLLLERTEDNRVKLTSHANPLNEIDARILVQGWVDAGNTEVHLETVVNAEAGFELFNQVQAMNAERERNNNNVATKEPLPIIKITLGESAQAQMKVANSERYENIKQYLEKQQPEPEAVKPKSPGMR